jgi:hypothetical protein
VIGAVEEHDVQVWIEPQVRRRSLHHADRAGLRLSAFSNLAVEQSPRVNRKGGRRSR